MAQHRRPGPSAGLAGVTGFRADGLRLATTGPNGDLKLWDTSTPRKPTALVRLSGRHRTIAAAWNPTAADLIATESLDASISVWRMVDGRPPWEILHLPLPSGRFGPIAWLPDGRHLACATSDGSISVWSIATGAGFHQALGDPAVCLSLTASPDHTLRGIYRDGSVRRADPVNQPGPARAPRLAGVAAAAWSGGGRRLATAHGDGAIEVRDESLVVRWQRDVTGAGPLLLAWHDDDLIVADREAGRLLALDDRGRPIWQTPLDRTPTSLAAAGGLIAVGGCSFAPYLVDAGTGVPFSGP
jgi:WD40 repeat protein